MFIQIMPENEAFSVPYNPFDLGKVWPHKDYPVTEVDIID
jgi:catalase